MKPINKNRINILILEALAILSMWLVYFIVFKIANNEYLVPSMIDMLREFFALFTDGFFYTSLFKTLLNVIISFVVSFVLAGIICTLAKIYKPFSIFTKPYLSAIRTIPTMALLVIILIYTNTFVAPIIVAFLVLFPMIFEQFNRAYEGIDNGLITAMNIFNVSKRDRIFKIYIPMIIPPLALNLGSNLSFTIKLVISAEVMAYSFTSIGGLMQGANAMMNIPQLFALTLLSVVLGLIFEFGFSLIFKNFFKWTKGGIKND